MSIEGGRWARRAGSAAGLSVPDDGDPAELLDPKVHKGGCCFHRLCVVFRPGPLAHFVRLTKSPANPNESSLDRDHRAYHRKNSHG